MAPKAWLTIARRSLLALAGEVCAGFGLGFNPGWANGWPFGLTIYSVWSTAMSVLFSLLVITVAAGAVAGAVCSSFDVGQHRGRAVYAGWLACSGALGLVAGRWAFRQVYVSTLEMWPNGYSP
jgi:hypothetical protein